MRMEDLDPDRSKSVYAEAAYDDLRWLGIRWQEGPDKAGPDKGGPCAPYVQSRRRSVYLAAWRTCCGAAFFTRAAVRAKTLKQPSALRMSG